MNPNFLLMALAGLSRDPNAGMNALKGYTVANELATKERERQASGQASAAALEVLKQQDQNQQTETGLQNRASAISQMPEQLPAGPNTANIDVGAFAPVGTPNVSELMAPNQERQAQEQQLASDIQKYKQAKIHPADTLISVLKNNPDVPADVAAKYVGLVYTLKEKEQAGIEKMGQIITEHKLNLIRDYKKEEAKASFKQTTEPNLHPTSLTTKEGVPISQNLKTGEYMIPGPNGKPVSYSGETFTSKSDTETDAKNRARELQKKVNQGIKLTPDEQAELSSYKTIATLGPTAYGNVRLQIANLEKPTTTPGVTYSPSGGYQIDIGGGKKLRLNTQEVQDVVLGYKESLPTETIKVMQQTAPKVIDIIKNVRKDLELVKDLGPVGSRWQDFLSNKIGSPNPAFTALRDDINLLSSLLMRMHVGARSAEMIDKKFQDMFGTDHQSIENIKAGLAVTERYAKETGARKYKTVGDIMNNLEGGNPSNPSPGGTLTPTHKYVPGRGLVPIGGQ